MPRRRLLSVLGPALALGVLVPALACGCMTWSVDLPTAASFVGRDLCERYGVALAAQGPVQVSLLPLPRIRFDGVRLSAGGEDGPVLAQGGSLTLQLGLGALVLGRIEPVSLALDGAAVALPEGEGDARWAGPHARLSAALAQGASVHPRRITLTHATVTGRDPRDGRPETARDVDLVLSWPRWGGAIDLAGGLTWNGAAVRFALAGLQPEAWLAGRESPFSASLTWPAGSLTADGSAASREGLAIAGQASLRADALPETLAWIGSDIALSPLIEALTVDGRFEASPEGLRLPSMRVAAGGSVLEGAGSVEMTGRRPSIRATLDAQEINLGPLLAGLLRVAGLDGEASWAHRPLALAPLTGGDLDLRLSGGKARLGPVVVADLAAGVIVRADGLDVTLGRAALQGGTLKGRVALASAPAGSGRDPGETEIRAQGAFDGLDLGALLVDLGEAGWLLGATRGSFALEGRGRDADSLVRRLSGRAKLAVEGGAIAGLDLADVIQRGGAVAPGALARRNARTPFERASVSFAFSEGVGEIEEGGLTTRALTASLRGRVSLPERRFLARAALLRRSASGETAPATLFEIAGPWDAVTVAPVRGKAGTDDPVAAALLRGPAATALPSQLRAYAP